MCYVLLLVSLMIMNSSVICMIYISRVMNTMAYMLKCLVFMNLAQIGDFVVASSPVHIYRHAEDLQTWLLGLLFALAFSVKIIIDMKRILSEI